MSAVQKRRRAKIACEPCRALKRKCDGAQPCTACVRFEYECAYNKTLSSPAARGSTGAHRPIPSPTGASPFRTHATRTRQPCEDAATATSPEEKSLRSLEANSGAAFVRRLALRIDPNNAPRAHLFAWNPFLGSRSAMTSPQSIAMQSSITQIMSQSDMQAFSEVYFKQVDPVYGVIDRNDFDQHVKSRWIDSSFEVTYDAVLCGVAALGYLFSNVKPERTELELVDLAKRLLETALSQTPTVTLVTAWVLRVTYLRITGTPHAAWMASCILMHMVEAAGLHCEPADDFVSPTTSIGQTVEPDTRRRIFGISQHLNTWMSFDMARSRIVLHNATTLSPTPREGDFTVELIDLLPYSAILNPDREPEIPELETALAEILSRGHSKPPSVLAQCNLMLCICRRLKSNNIVFSGELLVKILDMARQGVQAAQVLVDLGAPWHHMANVPFQVVCILLAIDTCASISQLRDAMQCLSSAAAKYNTEALQEAVGTASLLILLHQKRKQKAVAKLNEVLQQYPVPTPFHERVANGAPQAPQSVDAEVGWLDGLVAEIPSLQDIDLDAFLSQEFLWENNLVPGQF